LIPCMIFEDSGTLDAVAVAKSLLADTTTRSAVTTHKILTFKFLRIIDLNVNNEFDVSRIPRTCDALRKGELTRLKSRRKVPDFCQIEINH